MNERIRQLMLQATMIKEVNCEGYLGRSYTRQEEYFDKEKFAELIVQECLKKVEEEYKPVLEDKEMMKDTHWDGYVQCGVDSYVAIREHFGVKE